MPRSKRVKVISLTKTQPKDKDFKSKIIANDVRARFKSSKICLGKNKVMAAAIGKSEADEFKDGMRHISEKLVGDCGILCTNESREDVVEYFNGLVVTDFAKAGAIPKDSIVMKPGPLTFPVDMLDQLRKLGLVVEISNGTMVLKTAFQVSKSGVALTPEQAKVLVHMGKKISVFKVEITGHWYDGDFEEL